MLDSNELFLILVSSLVQLLGEFARYKFQVKLFNLRSSQAKSFLKNIFIFVYCGFALVAVSWGCSLAGVRRLLIVVAFVVREQAHALGRVGFSGCAYELSTCGSRVQAR